MFADRVRELLHYDPETGLFTWRISRGRCAAGDTAGTIKDNGYVQIKIDGTFYLAHRLAFVWMTGEWPKRLTDHRFGNRADNRWSVLRTASNADNARNCIRMTNATGVRGVYIEARTGKFYAQIRIGNGKRLSLGTFFTLEEAKRKRERAAAEYHREFARFD